MSLMQTKAWNETNARALQIKIERFSRLLNKATRGLTTLCTMDECLLSKHVIHGMWTTLQAHWDEVDAQPLLRNSSHAFKTAYGHFEIEFAAVPTVASSCMVDIDGGYDGLQKLKAAESVLVSVMHVLDCEFGLLPF